MSRATRSEKPSGRLRRLLGRLASGTEAEHETMKPRQRSDRLPGQGLDPAPGAGRESAGDCTPIRDCDDRKIVTVTGTLRSVATRPRGGVPALEAELFDGSAALDVVWLGRRAIAGIEPGRTLIASGRVTMNRGRPVLFNPKYELRPLGQE